jgi:hypothetical protein
MTSSKREKIIATMRERVAAGTWTAIDGNTIRWSERDLPTPEWAQRDGHLRRADWPAPTYDRHVFVTMHRSGSPIVGVAPAPWVGRNDSYATLDRVAELLADPTSAFRPRTRN